MKLDPNKIKIEIENQEQSYYGEILFDVIVEMFDLDTNRWIVMKTEQHSVSGDYCNHDH